MCARAHTAMVCTYVMFRCCAHVECRHGVAPCLLKKARCGGCNFRPFQLLNVRIPGVAQETNLSAYMLGTLILSPTKGLIKCISAGIKLPMSCKDAPSCARMMPNVGMGRSSSLNFTRSTSSSSLPKHTKITPSLTTSHARHPRIHLARRYCHVASTVIQQRTWKVGSF